MQKIFLEVTVFRMRNPLITYNIKTGVYRIHCKKCGHMEKYSAARNVQELIKLARQDGWHIKMETLIDPFHSYCPECKYIGRKRKDKLNMILRRKNNG